MIGKRHCQARFLIYSVFETPGQHESIDIFMYVWKLYRLPMNFKVFCMHQFNGLNHLNLCSPQRTTEYILFNN